MRSRSFGDLGILDGEVVFATAFKDGIRPDEAMGVAEWADRYRVLSAVASSEPGRWRTDRTPYLREILDCLSPQSDVQSVVFMKGAQIGGSEAGYNWIGYIIHKAPGPTMIVQPSIDLAETTSKQRLAPMIELIPELKERIGEARSRDSGNTLLQKEFPGGMLKLAGANSAASLRSLPIKYLMLDETDAYDADVEGEGSPIDLAKKRTATFARKKILEISTPTLEGSSNIEASYLESDQRRFEVPCPHCNHYQVLRWSGMKWEKDQGAADPLVGSLRLRGEGLREADRGASERRHARARPMGASEQGRDRRGIPSLGALLAARVVLLEGRRRHLLQGGEEPREAQDVHQHHARRDVQGSRRGRAGVAGHLCAA